MKEEVKRRQEVEVVVQEEEEAVSVMSEEHGPHTWGFSDGALLRIAKKNK